MSEEAKPEVTTEEQPAVTEQPPAETPATETPAAETPAAETPATETPAAETPAAETPAAETPAAETPAAETPAAEQPAAEEAPKTDDQPAVTEVTEVTEQPAATEEQGEAKKEEGEKKEEEKPKEEKKKEAKPKAVKPPVDYRTVKSGGVQKQGVIFKSFKHYFMTLDEDGSVLRWWRNEQRTSSDGALFMKFCAKVTEPTDEFTTNNWPAETEDRRFVISSPHRAFYLVADTADERNDWIAKLTDAMNKYKEEGIKVITTNPMSVESFKASISKASDEAEYTLEKEGVTGKKTEETPKTEEEATPAAATEEPKAEEEDKPETEVKVEVEVETTATEEPPKTQEAAEKKEEEKPVEGEGGEESKTE